MKDFYYILGVSSTSTPDEIREAYRKLSKKFHPDANQGDAYFEDRFKEINEAYETLSDPVKRDEYDTALKKINPGPGNQANSNQQSYRQHTGNYRYKYRRYTYSKPKRKGPGVGMSVVLILIALVLGVYIVESFSSTKKTKVKAAAVAVSAATTASHKHHKKRHSLRNHTGDSSLFNPAPLKPVQVATKIDNKQPAIANDKPPAATIIKKPEITAPFLYTGYIRANITGVINVRKAAEYSSQVIATIPANAKVLVLQKGDAYDKVSYNNITGYVPQWSVKTNK